MENLEEPCIPLLAVHLGDLTHTFDSSWKSKKIGQEEKDQLADSLPKPSSTKKTKNRPKSEISGCGKVIRLRSEQELGKVGTIVFTQILHEAFRSKNGADEDTLSSLTNAVGLGRSQRGRLYPA